jgi:hypothetical protein
MLRWRVVCVILVFAVLAALAAGCGGGEDKSGAGQAGAAVATFWRQERDSGALPEGTGMLPQGGDPAKKLKPASGQKARYCVQFRYISQDVPHTPHTRVYVASFEKNDWSIKVVQSETCDDVN